MPRTRWIVLALLILQAALVLLFVVPARDPEPHGLPIGVVGPPSAVPAGDGFDVHRHRDAAAARDAIREREVYGAIVPAERRVLVASAASPAVAQSLRERLGRGAAGASRADDAAGAGRADDAAGAGRPLGVTVEDVVPVASGDPRGAALAGLFLPLMIACFPLAGLLGRRGSRRALLGAVLGFSALSGLVLTALLGAMDALPGPYLAVSAVAALIVAAVALPATGLMRLLGPAGGLGVTALLFVVLGNPGSGNASAPELLPGFWRVTGQLLPPGAGGQALRDVAYFDGHGLVGPALVLAAWAVLGAALILAPKRRRAAPAPVPEARVAVPA